MALDWRWQKNRTPFLIGIVSAAVSIVLLASGIPYLPWLVVAVIDTYLALLIRSAARTGMTHVEHAPKMPDRDWGLLVLPLLFIALVTAFAGIYIGPRSTVHSSAGDLQDPWNAIYFSVVTITTVGYGDYAPVSTVARSAAVLELLSGMLVLLLAFPVLASRLAGFGDSRETAGMQLFDFHRLKISLPPSENVPVVTQTQFTWTRPIGVFEVSRLDTGFFQLSLGGRSLKSNAKSGDHFIVVDDGVFSKL